MVEKTRTDLLNFLAEKYNLQRYLEIGVQVPEINFDKVRCQYKIGVDPDPEVDTDLCMTSDEFFKSGYDQIHVNEKPGTKILFDLVFIDGLHTAEQVKKDFENALKILSPNGFIVLHDCNPEKEEHTIVPRQTKTGHWNGDVYKFAASMYKRPFWTVDIDNGCMVVKPEKDFFNDEIDWANYITWKFFDENRMVLLNLVSWETFLKSHES